MLSWDFKVVVFCDALQCSSRDMVETTMVNFCKIPRRESDSIVSCECLDWLAWQLQEEKIFFFVVLEIPSDCATRDSQVVEIHVKTEFAKNADAHQVLRDRWNEEDIRENSVAANVCCSHWGAVFV